MDLEVAERMRPFAAALRMLDQVPGIGRRVAEAIIAELGTDMSRWLTHAHLASWAKMCPGNNQSGGKSRGLDCPGWAWPDDPTGLRLDICDNGVKHAT